MIVSTAIQKMIEFYKGNRHDVNHFLKVWAMAKTIGELEGLDRHTQEAGKPGAGRGVFHRAARCAS